MPGAASRVVIRVVALVASLTALALPAGCGGGSSNSSSAAGSGQGSSSNAASFGQEAGAADRAAATRTVQDFLSAWINEDPAKACALMAASTKQNLAAFSSQLNSPDCPGEAKTVRAAMSARMLSRLRGVQVTGVRVEGGRGFVIYRAQGASWALPVLREGSAWKVGAIAGYKLP